MYKTPTHIKEHVNRIIKEYEILLQQNHAIALQLFLDNRIYSGIETTEYFLKSARHFHKLLDSPCEYLAAKTEEDLNDWINAFNRMKEQYENKLSAIDEGKEKKK